MSDHDDLVESWQDEFRAAYSSDERNAARQSFEEYWNWVKVLLVTGGAGHRGWLDRGNEVLRAVRDPAVADRLRQRVHAVGRAIAREWAKDSRRRRVHSTPWQGVPNLQSWGRLLQRAAAEDPGDGSRIGTALETIEEELRLAVGR